MPPQQPSVKKEKETKKNALVLKQITTCGENDRAQNWSYKSSMRVERMENIEPVEECTGCPKYFQISDVVFGLFFFPVLLAVLCGTWSVVSNQPKQIRLNFSNTACARAILPQYI